MKYYLIDNCTTSRSAICIESIKADSFEDALRKVEAKWQGLASHDKRDRDEYILGEVDEKYAEAIDAEYEWPGDYFFGNAFNFCEEA